MILTSGLTILLLKTSYSELHKDITQPWLLWPEKFSKTVNLIVRNLRICFSWTKGKEKDGWHGYTNCIPWLLDHWHTPSFIVCPVMALRYWIQLVKFPPFRTKAINFVTVCLYSCTPFLLWKEVYSKSSDCSQGRQKHLTKLPHSPTPRKVYPIPKTEIRLHPTRLCS